MTVHSSRAKEEVSVLGLCLAHASPAKSASSPMAQDCDVPPQSQDAVHRIFGRRPLGQKWLEPKLLR